jgi:hypothetical protein
MEIEEFEEAIRKDDFATGDSFWIGDWEFQVVNGRKGNALVEDEVVFKWELTREEFIQVITGNHPEIKNPEEFFDRLEDEIIDHFKKGFDVLVGECGATYGTLMNDAIDEVVSRNQNLE